MATPIYLDLTSGNDTNNGLTVGAPKKTLSSAVTAVDANGTIILLDGTHTISANTTTTISKNVTITSQGGEATDCIIDGDGTYYYYIIMNGIIATVSNITFKDLVPATGTWVIQTVTNSSLVVDKCIFDTVYHNNLNGEILGDRSCNNVSLLVKNCLFYNCTHTKTDKAAIAVGTLSTLNILNCTVYNLNTTISFFSKVSSGTLTIKNLIYYHDSAVNTIIMSGVSASNNLYNSCLYQAGLGTITKISGDTLDVDQDNITSDPLFVDESSGNWNLRPTSPCIDTGILI